MSDARSLGPTRQALLFLRLRGTMLGNALRQMFRTSIIRPLTIVLCSLLVWGFVFGVSFEGFHFMQSQSLELGGELVGILFDLLFLALMGLLIFSSGLILYSSLFNSQETAFLLSGPASADQVFAFKYQGALAFSSWAFLLLGAPILIAYGIVHGAPASFYLLLPLFFFGFVLIPGSLGAIVCLLLVNYLPRHRRQVVVLILVVLAALLVLWGYSMISAMGDEDSRWTRDAVERLIGKVNLAQSPLMPNHWVSWGLLRAASAETGRSLYYLALVWANGLFLYLVAAWLAKKLYRRGFNRLSTGGTLRQRYGGHWLDDLLERCLFLADRQTRLLIVKDFRTFRRDPAQWAQIVIFGGLLLLYFLNIRKLFLGDISWGFQNGLSLLNLLAVALLLCTYTGRFIYPLLSLEGRKFWVLGLLPLQREKLLWGKFAFSAVGSLFIAELLVVISDVMLGMPWLIVVLHVLTVAVLAAGLSGLAVGLGACLPNFRETDPSKIAAGFGGTLNLVVGLGYLVAVIGLMAGPWHAFAAFAGGPVTSVVGVLVSLGCAVVGLVGGSLAVFLPLYFGARNLRKMEF